MPPEQAFIVPDFETLSLQAPSPVAGRVVTLERVFAAWVIHEYTDEMSWQREWMYDDDFSQTIFPGIDSHALALSQFILFVSPQTFPPLDEPAMWTRAVDVPDGQPRTRRGRIREDGSYYFVDSTEMEKI